MADSTVTHINVNADSVRVEKGMAGKIAVEVKKYGTLDSTMSLIDEAITAAQYAFTEADKRLSQGG